jgi:hypothetical protein
MKTTNAQIKSTVLGPEDHGIMTFIIGLEFDGCYQSFGGYALDWNDQGTRRTSDDGHNFLMIRKIIEAVGVRSWEDLKGQYCRIEREDGWNGKIIGIGHIVNDQWFRP